VEENEGAPFGPWGSLATDNRGGMDSATIALYGIPRAFAFLGPEETDHYTANNRLFTALGNAERR
jgi:hypothetical protein